MKSFEIFVSNNGYSFVNGELLEVRIDTYAYQKNGSIDICVLHREKEYWVPADNFYLSVDDYERNIRPETTMQYLACWVNYDNPKERTTWVVKNNQPVKVVVDPLVLYVHVDKNDKLSFNEDEVPSQTFCSYERAMQHCDLVIKKEDGTEEVRESLVKLVKPTEEQMTLLKQLQELEKKISESGLMPIINYNNRYFINTNKPGYYSTTDVDDGDANTIHLCDTTTVPFGYSHYPVCSEEVTFYVER